MRALLEPETKTWLLLASHPLRDPCTELEVPEHHSAQQIMRRASALKRIADSTVSAWRAEARQVTQAPASEVPKLGFLTPAQPGTVNDFGHHVFIRGIPKREGAAHPAWSDIVERYKQALTTGWTLILT